MSQEPANEPRQYAGISIIHHTLLRVALLKGQGSVRRVVPRPLSIRLNPPPSTRHSIVLSLIHVLTCYLFALGFCEKRA